MTETNIHPLVLGIDTGGTYTDGVLMDPTGQEILATHKTLTTHHDLRACILDTLDALLPADPARVKLVCISTTLVTNAIAEGKSRPVALFLFGYDEELLQRFRLKENFGPSEITFLRGGHDLYGQEQAAPDLDGLVRAVGGLDGRVEALAVSAYFSPLDAGHEEAAAQALAGVTSLPVVLGHELSTRLDSVRRAATAALNASLLSISGDFIQSVQAALAQRGVAAPLMIVRGDGALMNGHSAGRRPVETIHSGPAASAIGARFLARLEKGLVIDIGGTTTDVAVIEGGRVKISEDGPSVGAYRTSVRSANVHSFALGGDSRIAFDSAKRLQVGPERVVPISHMAARHPQVAAEIRQLALEGFDRPQARRLEYWFVQRENPRPIMHAPSLKALELLRQRPYTIPDLLKMLGMRSAHQLRLEELLKEDILGRSGLTPTDLLHVSGEYAPWDSETAAIAARSLALNRRWSLETFVRQVKEAMAERISAEVITFITGSRLAPDEAAFGRRDLGEWLYRENVRPENPYLGCEISLKMPIIGLGAPAPYFLPRVAELLHSELVLPPHYAVANAAGAVAGSIIAEREANLLPLPGLQGYTVQNETMRRDFPSLEEAAAFAQADCAAAARREAREMGAEETVLECERTPTGADSYRLTVRAIGNPALD